MLDELIVYVFTDGFAVGWNLYRPSDFSHSAFEDPVDVLELKWRAGEAILDLNETRRAIVGRQVHSLTTIEDDLLINLISPASELFFHPARDGRTGAVYLAYGIDSNV